MKKDHRGLTLIELVVTVAIIAIFTGIVLSFITSSSNEFRNTSSNTKVQRQTQETVDKIQEILIDANRGIHYSVNGTDTENDIPRDEQTKSLAGGTKELSVFTIFTDAAGVDKGKIFTLQWNADESKLQYASSDCDLKDENGQIVQAKGTAASVEPPHVLLSNMKEFCVDLSKLESEQVVRFRISVDEKGKIITTDHVINLRNRIKIMDFDSAFVVDGKGEGVIRIYTPSEGAVFQAGASFTADWTQPDTSKANILQSSIKWTVKSDTPTLKYTFSQIEDHAEIQTIKGSGVLTITVNAVDVNGKPTSDEIHVSVSDYELSSLIVTGTKLVGEGSTYPILDNWSVTGMMKQGEEERPATEEDLKGLVWLVDGEEIQGNLSIDEKYEGKTSVNIRAKVGNFESEPAYKVDIARVKIGEYIKEINKKDPIQIAAAIYYEGDQSHNLNTENQKVNGHPVSWKLMKDGKVAKDINGAFEQRDKGNWTLRVEVQFDNNSKVWNEQPFDVNILSDYQIVGPEYLVHNDVYSEGFSMLKGNDDPTDWNQFWLVANDGIKDVVYKDCTWSVFQYGVKGNKLTGTFSGNGFSVYDDAEFVILKATAPTMEEGESASLPIPVLDIEITHPADDSKLNKADKEVICSAETYAGDEVYSENNYMWKINGKDNNRQKEFVWNIENEQFGINTIKAMNDVSISRIGDPLFAPKVQTFTLSDEIKVEIEQKEYEILGPDAVVAGTEYDLRTDKGGGNDHKNGYYVSDGTDTVKVDYWSVLHGDSGKVEDKMKKNFTPNNEDTEITLSAYDNGGKLLAQRTVPVIRIKITEPLDNSQLSRQNSVTCTASVLIGEEDYTANNIGNGGWSSTKQNNIKSGSWSDIQKIQWDLQNEDTSATLKVYADVRVGEDTYQVRDSVNVYLINSYIQITAPQNGAEIEIPEWNGGFTIADNLVINGNPIGAWNYASYIDAKSYSWNMTWVDDGSKVTGVNLNGVNINSKYVQITPDINIGSSQRREARLTVSCTTKNGIPLTDSIILTFVSKNVSPEPDIGEEIIIKPNSTGFVAINDNNIGVASYSIKITAYFTSGGDGPVKKPGEDIMNWAEKLIKYEVNQRDSKTYLDITLGSKAELQKGQIEYFVYEYTDSPSFTRKIIVDYN